MNERSIFLDALELTDPEARWEYLDRACGDDRELRVQVEELLESHSAASSFLEKPPVGLAATIAGGTDDTVGESLDCDSLRFLAPSEKPGCLGTLAQYEVVDVVGRGGMGIVLRAYDTKLNRVVAIKVMAPELAANRMAVKRFLREARAAAAVSHDHVVTIHAIEEDNRPPYIVMEFVDGQSLQEKIDRTGGLELNETLRIGMQMARGLGAAHEQGLVHRDIKPANILLENGVERVKLTDFGLARAVDDVSVTQTGQIAGTPQFMSPEQAQDHPIDARSDLFSLGSVLYTMCTGRPPFRAETAVAMLRRVTDDDPRPIREVNSGVPGWLEAIIFKLLAKAPAERFQSALEVAELLSQHLAHLQHPTTAPKPLPVVPPTRGAALQPATPASKTEPAAPTRSRGPLVAAGLALGVFIMVAVAAVAATVIYVKTDYGTIRVEVNDPNTTVTIDNEQGLSFHNSQNKGSLTVRAGGHKLHIKQGELEFETDRFRIRRGEQVLVSVELIDGKLGARLRRPETHSVEGGAVTYQRDRVIGMRRESARTQKFAIQTSNGTYLRYSGENKPVMTAGRTIGELETFMLEWQNAERTKAYVRTSHDLYLRGVPDRRRQLLAMDERGSSELFDVDWVDRQQGIIRLRTRDGVYVSADSNRARLTTSRRAGDTETFALIAIPGRPIRATADNASYAKPFVQLRRHRSGEESFMTLASAVAAARDGDTIEVRGNGPYVTEPLVIHRRSLTIRAAAGFRPVIELSTDVKDATPMIDTHAPLVIEGLKLVRTSVVETDDEDRGYLMINSIQAPLFVANCEFKNQFVSLRAFRSPDCRIMNCVFKEPQTALAYIPPSGGRLLMKNNLMLGGGLLHLHYGEGGLADDVTADLAHNTIVGRPLWLFVHERPNVSEPHTLPIRFNFDNNVVDAVRPMLHFARGGKLLQEPEPLSANEMRAALRSTVDWHEGRNLLSLRTGYVETGANSRSTSGPSFSIEANEDWQRLWNIDQAGALFGRANFAGGDPRRLSEADRRSLATGDLRLVSGLGVRASADGQNLGAALNYVGPGDGYERFSATNEYQRYRVFAESVLPPLQLNVPPISEIGILQGHTDIVCALDFMPDGKSLVSGSQEVVYHWDLATERVIREIPVDSPVKGLAALPNGQHVITSHEDGSIRMWNLADGVAERQFTGHTGEVPAIAISTDGKRFVVWRIRWAGATMGHRYGRANPQLQRKLL